MSEVVKLDRHDGIGIVTVNSPPVNALSAAVRGGIFECVKSAIADPEVKGIVLTCGGRTFIAGADITEFGKPPKPPGLHEVLDLIEGSPKPVIAAINGVAAGGDAGVRVPAVRGGAGLCQTARGVQVLCEQGQHPRVEFFVD